MHLADRARKFFMAFMALAMATLVIPASAQDDEIAESHLKAARAALTALKATEQFDAVLPAAAQALQSQLIQKNPDLRELISATVQEHALKLASRRADLEREAAKIYARVFTEQQLAEIADFYGSETGKKLLSDGDIVTRELLKAADIWQRGLARDLAQEVGEQLNAVTKSDVQKSAPAAAADQ